MGAEDEGAAAGVPTPAELSRIQSFLEERGAVRGPIALRAIGDGHSNPTFLLSDDARRLVLRRPPPPPVAPGTHDVLREARVLTALSGTGVPVPDVVAVAVDVVPYPFYVMSYVDGIVATDETPSALRSADGRRELGESLVDRLADLHAVDWKARGLEGFGRPEGYAARQLGRIERLVQESAGPTRFAVLRDWLRDRVPPPDDEASVLHGDYRLGNVMLGHGAPARVVALLDWELASVGHPIMDLAYLLASYATPGRTLSPLAELNVATLEPGYPSPEHLAARYAERTGRDLAGLPWFTVLNLCRMALIFERNRQRYLAGTGDPYYADAGQVDRFLAAARATVEQTP